MGKRNLSATEINLSDKKRNLTVEEIDRRKCAAEHLKAFRTEMGWTQEKCSDEWGVSELTIRRMELNAQPEHLGQYPSTKKTAQIIAKHTGICWQYWFGITRHQNEIMYEAEKTGKERLERFRARDERNAQHFRLAAEYKSLFSRLGFQYENRVQDVDADIIETPHVLYSISGEKVAELSDAQLEGLMSYLKQQLAFSIFRLSCTV